MRRIQLMAFTSSLRATMGRTNELSYSSVDCWAHRVQAERANNMNGSILLRLMMVGNEGRLLLVGVVVSACFYMCV